MKLVHLIEPQRCTGRFSPFAPGFRLLFIGSGLLGAFLVPTCLMAFGDIPDPTVTVSAPRWHGYEIAFGLAAAMIAGISLTAVSNSVDPTPLRRPAPILPQPGPLFRPIPRI